MEVLAKPELDKLSIMYDGDKCRDASDKIRGYLFQDYIAIDFLLNDKVKCVCTEYLEDVDAFIDNGKKGKFEFAQVKYYPNTCPDKEEIMTDLYYQFLRLKMLKSEYLLVPRLYIYRPHGIRNVDIEAMKKYIGVPLKDKLPGISDVEKWLKDNVYISTKKEEQKKALFSMMATEESLREFLSCYKIVRKGNIEQVRSDLMNRLSKVYSKPDNSISDDNWKLILHGLAISRIQERYRLNNPSFEKIRIVKAEFDQYMMESTRTKTDQTIANYLIGLVSCRYEFIISNNILEDLDICMLYEIYQNTINWVNLSATDCGVQYKLYNTLSPEETCLKSEFVSKCSDDRLLLLAGCKSGLMSFLDYLWKIILDICRECIKKKSDIEDNKKVFDLINYMVPSVDEYVCFNFPEDVLFKNSVILPTAGSQINNATITLTKRMLNVSPKPSKWFIETSKLKPGKNIYNYSTADINEEPTIVDLGKDSFYIECMDCIKVDAKEWHLQEQCSNCIFSEKCVKEGTDS